MSFTAQHCWGEMQGGALIAHHQSPANALQVGPSQPGSQHPVVQGHEHDDGNCVKGILRGCTAGIDKGCGKVLAEYTT